MEILKPRKQGTIRREGHRLIILFDGQALMDMDYEGAIQLAQALIYQAKRIEEEVKAEQVIDDGAFAARTGAPFGFTQNPGIIQEIKKEAAWNTKLRRHVPQSKYRGILYPPVVKRQGDN